MRFNLKGEEWRILWVVLRKTWGWKEGDHKKNIDHIPLSQFEELTGMKRANVVRVLKRLVAHRLLLKRKSGYGINQNHDQWVVAHRLPGSSQATPLVAHKLPEVVAHRLPKVVAHRLPSIDKKDNIKEKSTSYSGAAHHEKLAKPERKPIVDLVINTMRECFGELDDTDRKNRRYAWLLILKAKKAKPDSSEEDAAKACVGLIRAASTHEWWGGRIRKVENVYRNANLIASALRMQKKNVTVKI